MDDLEYGVDVYVPVPQEWFTAQRQQTPTPDFELEQEMAQPLEEPA